MGDDKRPDVDKELARLKDFQKVTVEYAFSRMYDKKDPAHRFLVADEVGLGKTLVARGIVIKVIDHLWNDKNIKRIDIVYVCSNSQIATQNLRRLALSGDALQRADRVTLLASCVDDLQSRRVNFVSLSPGTSLDLKNASGNAEERLLLFELLGPLVASGAIKAAKSSLFTLMRANVGKDVWRSRIEARRAAMKAGTVEKVNDGIAEAFRMAVLADSDLLEEVGRVCEAIGQKRKLGDVLRRERNGIIGRLRETLAEVSLVALEPDLIILDEFQRFRNILDPEPENRAARLSRRLLDFCYKEKDGSAGERCRVLLLSATPYRMFTMEGEDEDHYADFKDTFDFLLERKDERAEFRSALGAYGESLNAALCGGPTSGLMAEPRQRLQSIMSRVMVRTERLGAGVDRNGMLQIREEGCDLTRPADIRAFLALRRVVGDDGLGSSLEYWKSSAYPLSIMDGYEIKDRTLKRLAARDEVLGVTLRESADSLLPWERVRAFEPVDIQNPRLRSLVRETVDAGLSEILWLPPSLPYYALGAPFNSVSPGARSKVLVFSAWRVAPKSIAMLLSYESERRARSGWTRDEELTYDELSDKVKPLLKFAMTDGRQTGLSTFCLLYPCASLAHAVDPLLFASRFPASSPSLEEVLVYAESTIEDLIQPLKERYGVGSTRSDRWCWAALPILDTLKAGGLGPKAFFKELVRSIRDEDAPFAEAGDDDGSTVEKAIDELLRSIENPALLGPLPEDLAHVLALVALGSPATCMLRSFMRNSDSEETIEEYLGAWNAGMGFRSLFNQPEAIFLLQRKGEAAYWRSCLEYAVAGNLQALFDEMAHVLREHLGLVQSSSDERAAATASYIAEAASLRSPSLAYESLLERDEAGKPLKRRIRCRFALRYGDEKSDDGKYLTRAADVQNAFNSPFRPFVLATTSVGQEGLDFHLYCRKVVHWNLPTNPVDLEQREGRVHRYKCLSVRCGIAETLREAVMRDISQGTTLDVWTRLFELAAAARAPGVSELYPYWLFPAKDNAIQRIIWPYPMSRDLEAYARLKKACARYRAVLGQPRQEELLALMDSESSRDDGREIWKGLDLSPRR